MTNLKKLFALGLVALLVGCSGGDEDSDPGPDEDTVGSDEAPLTGGWDYTSETAELTHINNRRIAIGRRALNRRACLNSIARTWSNHLASQGSLSHNPNLAAQVNTKCGAVGLHWKGLGENVGLGSTELSVWNAFMASAPHKANIQGSSWDSVGIGVYKRADGTLFITQIFADF
jgi:uncharacterized protein YkwD